MHVNRALHNKTQLFSMRRTSTRADNEIDHLLSLYAKIQVQITIVTLSWNLAISNGVSRVELYLLLLV